VLLVTNFVKSKVKCVQVYMQRYLLLRTVKHCLQLNLNPTISTALVSVLAYTTALVYFTLNSSQRSIYVSARIIISFAAHFRIKDNGNGIYSLSSVKYYGYCIRIKDNILHGRVS